VCVSIGTEGLDDDGEPVKVYFHREATVEVLDS
jgi:hypothetical protein